jgi:hypothetical protein
MAGEILEAWAMSWRARPSRTQRVLRALGKPSKALTALSLHRRLPVGNRRLADFRKKPLDRIS